MRRWAPPAALGAFLATAGLLGVLALWPGSQPTAAERAETLAAELRCPDCQGLAVADSPTTAAAEIRRQIDALLADGASDTEIRAHFTARYGEWILLAPSSPLSWAIPFVAVGIGVALLAWWLVRRGRGVPQPAGTSPLSGPERRRIREEAEALDA